MATLAKLVVKLVTDVTEFTGGLDTASKKLAKVSDSMISMGNKLTIGVTAPLLAAGTAAVKLASDLKESQGKANLIFGDMADDVHKFALTAVSDLGMTQRETLEFASTFGAILKNSGLAEAEVAKMSTTLTQLTADYGALHNISAADAFEKIRASMVGSAEPLLSLGKDLRQGAVEAYAMANGIGDATGALTNQELALARYGLLLSQSTDEIGNFKDTAGDLAGSMKILDALSKELLTSLGQELVPAVTELIHQLIPLLKKFNEMDPAVKSAMVKLLMYAAAAGPVIRTLGMVTKAVSWLMATFAGKTAAATTAIKIFTKLSGVFSGLTISGAQVIGAISGFGSALAAALGPALALGIAISALIVVIKLYGAEFMNSIKIIFDGVINVLVALVKHTIDTAKRFREQGKSLMTGIVYGMAQGIYNGAGAIWNALLNTIFKPFVTVIDQIRKLLKLSSPSKVFEGIGMNMMLGLAEGIEKYAPKSIDANIKTVNDLTSPKGVYGLKSGRGSITNHNEFVFHGDISESAKKSLRIEFNNLFETNMKAIFE